MAEVTRELKDTQTNVDKLEFSKVHQEERINDLKKTNSLLEEGNSDLKVIHYFDMWISYFHVCTYIVKEN